MNWFDDHLRAVPPNPGPTELYARCNSCGKTFKSDNISGTGAFGLSVGPKPHPMTGIRIFAAEIGCPFCGGRARMLEGNYINTDQQGFQFISGPAETEAFIKNIRIALQKAQQGSPPEEVVQALEEISPELADAARGYISRLGFGALVALLMTFLSACQVNVDVKIDGTRTIQDLLYAMTGIKPFDDGATPENNSDKTQKIDDKTINERQHAEPQETSSLNKSQPSPPERRSKRQKRRDGQWHASKKNGLCPKRPGRNR